MKVTANTTGWRAWMMLFVVSLAATACVNDLTATLVPVLSPSAPSYQETTEESEVLSSTLSAEENSELLGEEARIVDAQLYASRYDIDLEEALRRLQFQDAIDGLEPVLIDREGDTFAGLWIQHTPQFRIVVA